MLQNVKLVHNLRCRSNFAERALLLDSSRQNSPELGCNQLASIPITLSRIRLFPSEASQLGSLTHPSAQTTSCLSHPSHYIILHSFPLLPSFRVNKYHDKCNKKLHSYIHQLYDAKCKWTRWKATS